jgi:CheY-like chemotaxis protein
MPDMTGSDLARRMMQLRPDLPIILCTGYSNMIDEHSAKALGIKAFALKPLTKRYDFQTNQEGIGRKMMFRLFYEH